INVPVTVIQSAAGATLTVTYQGCAYAGLCYPTETKTLPLSEDAEAIDAKQTPAVTHTSENKKPPPHLHLSAISELQNHIR
ncbi:protein-disulfide reductase DsbD domain-containing protein, partial [Salmonella enterica]|uniref:protein-disulfide reductase DsbD domain-containing protein n=1 Tax=Salmonella enterica TaxID=28901 RepID=UPI003F1BDF9C